MQRIWSRAIARLSVVGQVVSSVVSSGVLSAVVSAVVLGALGLGGSGCAGDSPPPPPVRAQVRAPDPTALHLGGTGALSPLAIRLAEEWARRHGVPPVIVEESVGSGGGVRAAADGAMDLGMVSRPLSPEERKLGLVIVPMGRDAAVLVAHPGVPVDGLSGSELLALVRGERNRFPDGSPAVPLLRDRSESANGALERLVPGLRAAREQAYRDRRLRVLYHDRAMAEAISSTHGSFGVFPLGGLIAMRLPFKVLSIDGVRPSPETLADGRWRATREIFFVARPERLERAEPFLRFVTSPEGRDLARACGYLPPEQPATPSATPTPTTPNPKQPDPPGPPQGATP
ncbi:MAG: substrate-binding domain-containing protein [Polyangia bacterium]